MASKMNQSNVSIDSRANYSYMKSIQALDLASITLNTDVGSENFNSPLKELTQKLGLYSEAQNIYNNMQKYEKGIQKRLNPTSSADLRAFELDKRRHNLYMAKLKLSINYYNKLNDKVMKDIKDIKNTIADAKIEMTSMTFSKREMASLETKVKQYEDQLSKVEKKNPWLKDPQFDLISLKKEISKLDRLKEEQKLLEDELNIYEGLKPDLNTAKRQLEMIKSEYKLLKETV